jgi:hypothetical protein
MPQFPEHERHLNQMITCDKSHTIALYSKLRHDRNSLQQNRKQILGEVQSKLGSKYPSLGIDGRTYGSTSSNHHIFNELQNRGELMKLEFTLYPPSLAFELCPG